MRVNSKFKNENAKKSTQSARFAVCSLHGLRFDFQINVVTEKAGQLFHHKTLLPV